MEVEPKSAVRTESGWEERVRKCHGANAADPFLSHLAAGRKHSTRSEIVKPEIQEMGPFRRAHDFKRDGLIHGPGSRSHKNFGIFHACRAIARSTISPIIWV